MSNNSLKDIGRLMGREPSDDKPSKRKTGVIKKVIRDFGFIGVEGEKDVHFRFSNFKSEVRPVDIREGLRVSFEIGEGYGGKTTAVNIEIIGRSDAQPKDTPRFKKGRQENYYLPADTRQLLEPQLLNQNRGEQQIDNFSLWLNKCPYYDDDPKGQGFVLYRKDKIEPHAVFNNTMLQAVNDRHRAAIARLYPNVEHCTLNPNWRLIVGLGGESVYETSMTLHHIYGIPYIPGQAVKGVVRSWCITEYFKNEEAALQKKWFCDIFGCSENSYYKNAHQGKVIFFDAFPTSLSHKSIQVDIMNPHYGPYYSEGKPPADYHNPVPVNFLTVQNTTFEFFIGIRKETNKAISDECFDGEKTLLQIAKESLMSALSEHGIGAKTAVGYGYFSELNQ